MVDRRKRDKRNNRDKTKPDKNEGRERGKSIRDRGSFGRNRPAGKKARQASKKARQSDGKDRQAGEKARQAGGKAKRKNAKRSSNIIWILSICIFVIVALLALILSPGDSEEDQPDRKVKKTQRASAVDSDQAKTESEAATEKESELEVDAEESASPEETVTEKVEKKEEPKVTLADAEGVKAEKGVMYRGKIESVDIGDKGMTHVGGKVVYVPDTDVGDHVTFRIFSIRGNFAYAKLIEKHDGPPKPDETEKVASETDKDETTELEGDEPEDAESEETEEEEEEEAEEEEEEEEEEVKWF